MSERPTPETDAFEFNGKAHHINSKFARRLERERDQSREESNQHYVNYLRMRHIANELSDIASKYLSFLLAITPTNPNDTHGKETEKVIDTLKRWKKI